jgi:hypothetical protein
LAFLGSTLAKALLALCFREANTALHPLSVAWLHIELSCCLAFEWWFICSYPLIFYFSEFPGQCPLPRLILPLKEKGKPSLMRKCCMKSIGFGVRKIHQVISALTSVSLSAI